MKTVVYSIINGNIDIFPIHPGSLDLTMGSTFLSDEENKHLSLLPENSFISVNNEHYILWGKLGWAGDYDPLIQGYGIRKRIYL